MRKYAAFLISIFLNFIIQNIFTIAFFLKNCNNKNDEIAPVKNIQRTLECILHKGHWNSHIFLPFASMMPVMSNVFRHHNNLIYARNSP